MIETFPAASWVRMRQAWTPSPTGGAAVTEWTPAPPVGPKATQAPPVPAVPRGVDLGPARLHAAQVVRRPPGRGDHSARAGRGRADVGGARRRAVDLHRSGRPAGSRAVAVGDDVDRVHPVGHAVQVDVHAVVPDSRRAAPAHLTPDRDPLRADAVGAEVVGDGPVGVEGGPGAEPPLRQGPHRHRRRRDVAHQDARGGDEVAAGMLGPLLDLGQHQVDVAVAAGKAHVVGAARRRGLGDEHVRLGPQRHPVARHPDLQGARSLGAEGAEQHRRDLAARNRAAPVHLPDVRHRPRATGRGSGSATSGPRARSP